MNLHDSLRECKRRLPLPELWCLLALRGEPKRSCESPFREDRNPSFSVFEQDGLWFWRDHALGIGGDEVDFLMHGRGCESMPAKTQGYQLPIEKFLNSAAWSRIVVLDIDGQRSSVSGVLCEKSHRARHLFLFYLNMRSIPRTNPKIEKMSVAVINSFIRLSCCALETLIALTSFETTPMPSRISGPPISLRTLISS